MGGPAVAGSDYTTDEALRATKRARWYYTLIPIYILLIVLVAGVPAAVLGIIVYSHVVPVILVIGAVCVLFVGAWSDFGAKRHVREVIHNRLPFTDIDMDHIYKQQFLLTMSYLGVAALYFLIAFLINALL
jgi:hypothetical protein